MRVAFWRACRSLATRLLKLREYVGCDCLRSYELPRRWLRQTVQVFLAVVVCDALGDAP